MPPAEVLIQIGYAAAVSAAALLFAWPWRERGSAAPVAIGVGTVAGLVALRGFPALWPLDATELLFHFALLGTAIGVVEASPRVSTAIRGGLGGLAVAASAWALLRTVDPAWRIALVAVGFLVAWSALRWRAGRVEGYGVPLVLMIVAGAGAKALEYGSSGLLAQTALALAAATVPLVAYAVLQPRLPLARGCVTAFTLVALPLWTCGARLANLPLESAALLAVAPLAAQRRAWVGALVAAATAGFAVYLAYAA